MAIDENLKTILDKKAVYLEKQRKKAVRLNYLYKIAQVLRLLFGLATVVLVIINIFAPILIPLLLIVAFVTLLLSIVQDPKEVFESKLKKNVLPEIMKHINPSFKYRPEGYNKQTLRDSKMMAKGYFRDTILIEGEDHVKGKINDIDVEFFEVRFFKKKINYAKAAGGCLFLIFFIPVYIFKAIAAGDGDVDLDFFEIPRDTIVFYSGFFMFADFHKDFKGKVMMMPKKNEKFADRANEIVMPLNLNKITVENPYINNHYNVYASDPQVGFYVLSVSLIERIQILSERENTLPIVSLIDGKMYFMIPWEKDFFTVGIKSKIENSDFFLPYIEEINSFEKIIEDLNQNTRIWTKV